MRRVEAVVNPQDIHIQEPLPIHFQIPAVPRLPVPARNEFDQYFEDNLDMEHIGEEEDPDEQGRLQQQSPQPPRQPAQVPAPLPVNQPFNPGPPIPGRTRCFPCYHARTTCDLPTRIAEAEANGVDTTVNQVCCIPCTKKLGGRAGRRGFVAAMCVVDPDTSRAAGYLDYLNKWRTTYGKK